MDLSNNNISNIEELKYFDSDNIKKINLGFNQINDIGPLKNLQKLEDINVQSNKISNIDPLKEMFAGNKEIKSINLNCNDIKREDIKKLEIPINLQSFYFGGEDILSELKEMKRLPGYDNYPSIIYEINSFDSKIRLFGKKFVERNRDKFKIIINGNQNDLIEFYTCKEDDELLKINIITTGDIIDASEMFYEFLHCYQLRKFLNQNL